MHRTADASGEYWDWGMRYLVTGGILLATIVWLVLSYMPDRVAMLPKLAFDSTPFATAFPWLAMLTLTFFLAVQLDLVRVTSRWFCQSTETPEQAFVAKAIVDFGLSRRWELFWTVLPLSATLILTLWLLIVR